MENLSSHPSVGHSSVVTAAMVYEEQAPLWLTLKGSSPLMLHGDPRNGGGNRFLCLSKWLFLCFCFSFMSPWKAYDLRENRKWWLKSETEKKKGEKKLVKLEQIKIILIKIPCSVAVNFCGTHDTWGKPARMSVNILNFILVFTRRIFPKEWLTSMPKIIK